MGNKDNKKRKGVRRHPYLYRKNGVDGSVGKGNVCFSDIESNDSHFTGSTQVLAENPENSFFREHLATSGGFFHDQLINESGNSKALRFPAGAARTTMFVQYSRENLCNLQVCFDKYGKHAVRDLLKSPVSPKFLDNHLHMSDSCEYSFCEPTVFEENPSLELIELDERSKTSGPCATDGTSVARREDETSNREINDSMTVDSNHVNYGDIVEVKVEGRRIVDINFFMQQWCEKLGNHSDKLECSFSDLKLFKVWDRGLRSQLFFKCQMCKYKFSIWTDPEVDHIMGINESAVCASITAGIGHSTMQEALAGMAIKPMTINTYIKYRNKLFDDFVKASDAEIQKAAALEREIAIKKNHVIDGVPYIPVVTDGCWSKRSYPGGKQNALSGAAMIFGRETKLVLFVGVRNKYCATCERAERLNKEAPVHRCYKNWGRDQSSTAMETDIILEGFNSSVERCGLIFKTLIADGDSSVYQAIRDADPYREYGVIVDKIECNNHLMRNLCRKFCVASKMAVVVDPAIKKINLKAFRHFVKSSGLKMRKVIERARDVRLAEDVSEEEKAKRLCKDIFAIMSHVYGEHADCTILPFECEKKTNEKNYMTELHITGVYSAVYEAVRYLSCHAKSLLKKITNNMAEGCNSIVNKLNSGKRINYCSTNSYEMRVIGATLQYNTQMVLSLMHSLKGYEAPNAVLKLEAWRRRKNECNRIRRHTTRPRTVQKFRSTDKDYGPSAEKPDLEKDVHDVLTEEHFKQLVAHQKNWEQIEKRTVLQGSSELWHHLRTKILTASRFGPICRMLPTTSCAKMVSSILFPKIIDTAAIKFGRDHEDEARKAVECRLGKKVVPCGLFIDQEISYLGASPDGLIGDDGIVEIKCPFLPEGADLFQAIQQKPHLKSIFDKKDINLLSKNHAYFYQVQGQLHVTKRSYCQFALWTRTDLKMVTVQRDDEFWDSKMKPFLCRFYMQCLLPEIIDSRRRRSMPIRDPEYILEARRQATLKKSSKKQCTIKVVEPIRKHCGQTAGEELEHKQVGETLPKIDNDIAVDDCVSISSDDETEVSNHNVQLLDMIRKNVTTEDVVPLVLSATSLLDDTSIDLFQNVLQENSIFQCNPASYTLYYTYIKPCPAGQRDIQIVGGCQSMHWVCLYYDGEVIFVYDSLNCEDYVLLSQEVKRYISRRYPHVRERNVICQFVTRQPDSFSCGIYATAFSTSVALGEDPSSRNYSRNAVQMRKHLVQILRSRKLTSFPLK